MKTIDELGISPAPWDYQPNHPDGCRVATAYNCDVSTAEPANARLIAAAPELYDSLQRIVAEIDKVIDHNVEGQTVIDCECSGIELAAEEAKSALSKASGEEAK